ncbi:hypothetical protein Sjap_012872 [Stephania japonica]|uniref:Uncharacterized protein n=1 Tax=Stephania japonica TaxID=461633 RepID=A0AAP0IY31_9MAGN
MAAMLANNNLQLYCFFPTDLLQQYNNNSIVIQPVLPQHHHQNQDHHQGEALVVPREGRLSVATGVHKNHRQQNRQWKKSTAATSSISAATALLIDDHVIS